MEHLLGRLQRVEQLAKEGFAGKLNDLALTGGHRYIPKRVINLFSFRKTARW